MKIFSPKANPLPLQIKLLPLILPFFLLAAFSSCSFQKRLYTSGYHVTWKGKTPQKTSLPEAFESKPNSSFRSGNEKKKISDENTWKTNISTENSTDVNNITPKIAIVTTTSQVSQCKPFLSKKGLGLTTKKSFSKKSTNPDDADTKNKKINKWALWGFTLSLLGIIGFLSLYLFNNLSILLFIILGLSVIFIILGFVFSIIGVYQLLNHSDSALQLLLAILGVILSVGFVFIFFF